MRDLPVERYKQVSLCWNGQRGPRQRGGLAPRGEYRLRVSLSGQDHPVYSPVSFALRDPSLGRSGGMRLGTLCRTGRRVDAPMAARSTALDSLGSAGFFFHLRRD